MQYNHSHSDSEAQNIQHEAIEPLKVGAEGENASTSKKEWLSNTFKKRLEEVRSSLSSSSSDDDRLAVIQADKFLIAKDAESFKKIEDLERQASETECIEEVYDINLQNVGAFFIQEDSLDLSKQIRDLYARTRFDDRLVLWHRIFQILDK